MHFSLPKPFSSLKITFAAVFAILLAEYLSLDFTISAGIVAILTVAPTKKETFRTATTRCIAFFVALIIAYCSFTLINYDLEGFFCYLLLFLWVCQWRNWQSAMAMNSVLISHFLTTEIMNLHTIINEISLFFVGTFFGVCANLYLRENLDYMKKIEDETDSQLKTILIRMSIQIKNQNLHDYNGECFQHIKSALDEASRIATENYMNQWKREETRDMQYISMRRQQTFILYHIYQKVTKLKVSTMTQGYISDYFLYLAEHFSPDTSTDQAMEKFIDLHKLLDETPLPETRKEFETRAELYSILGEMTEFLKLKQEFVDKTQNQS